jgi:hypothetical protein
MPEAIADTSFASAAKDTKLESKESLKAEAGNSLHDCAYDRNASSLTGGKGDKSAASSSLPTVEIVGESDDKAGSKKPEKNPAKTSANHPAPADGGETGGGQPGPGKTNGHPADAMGGAADGRARPDRIGGQPAESMAGAAGGGQAGRPDRIGGHPADAMAGAAHGQAGDAKPPSGNAFGSAVGEGGAMGAAAHPPIGGLQPTPPEFRYSKEQTAAAALNMFAKDELDLNGDGYVNKVELSRKHDELEEAAKKNPKSKELLEKRQAVNYMLSDYTNLSNAHNDEYFSETSGITIHDLASTVSSVNKAKHSGN